MDSIQSQRQRQRAQTLVEFGLLLALVAVVAVAGLIVFGSTVSSLMSDLSHTVAANINS
jgi:Flp pilus assembly pilin Flp